MAWAKTTARRDEIFVPYIGGLAVIYQYSSWLLYRQRGNHTIISMPAEKQPVRMWIKLIRVKSKQNTIHGEPLAYSL